MKILSSLGLEEIVTEGPRSRGSADNSTSWWGLQAGSPWGAGWGVQTATRFSFSSQTETSQIKPLSALSSNHGDASAASSRLSGDREELYRTGGCLLSPRLGARSGATAPGMSAGTEAKVQTSGALLAAPGDPKALADVLLPPPRDLEGGFERVQRLFRCLRTGEGSKPSLWKAAGCGRSECEVSTGGWFPAGCEKESV